MPETGVSSIQPTAGGAIALVPQATSSHNTSTEGVALFVSAPHVPIHTIPERFLPSHHAGTPVVKKQSKGLLIGLIVIIWIVIIGVVLWIFVGKRFVAPQATSGVNQQISAQNQIEQSAPQQEEQSIVAPKTIEAAVRNGAGKIISRATLLVPENEQSVSFTLVGKSISDDAKDMKRKGIYGEYIIRPVAPVLTPLSLSIAIPAEDITQKDLRIATWNEEKEEWTILENSFFDAEKSQATVLLSAVSADSYGIVSEQAVISARVPESETPEQLAQPSAKPERSDDTDGDGLADLEEFLYGTDPTIADTDKDSYRDGAEVLNLFSPRKQGEARLAQDDKIAIYANPIHGYTLLYPGSWAAEPVDDQSQNEVIIATTTDEEYISVTVDQNLDNASLLDWYQAHNQSASLETMRVQSFQNLDLLWTADEKTVFTKAVGVAKIISFKYESGNKQKLNFLTTFEMIARGLRVEGAQKRNTQDIVSRDTDRIESVKKVQTALELYYNDNNSYPLGDASQGTVLSGDEVKPFSSYLPQFPQAPTPADGACGDKNRFQYRALDSSRKECTATGSCALYEFSFCLGVGIVSFTPGVHIATPDGIL